MQGVKRFSHDQARIFETSGIVRLQQQQDDDGDWVDLYALLQVDPDTTTRDLDEAIIDRGADVVYFTFSRAGKPAQVERLEEHLREMRPILLDPPVRRRYDEQLQLHRNNDPRAMRYEDFLKTLDLRDQANGCLASLVFLIVASTCAATGAYQLTLHLVKFI